MILKKYLLKRFFKYLFIINISLTLLFNFINFFEKIIRVKHASLSIISKFIMLNLPTSFFNTLNISCWLATCLLIKELEEQNEWETFKILNINYNKLYNLFLLAGIITVIIAFIGKEELTLNLENKSEKLKLIKIKQNSYQKIYNKWTELIPKNKKYFKTFSFFQFLNLDEKKGSNLIFVNLNKNFEIENITNTNIFKIYPHNKEIVMEKAIKINNPKGTQTITKNKKIYYPSFFSQLKLNNLIQPFYLLFKNIILEKKILPRNAWYELISKLLKRFFFYFQIILYPVLTLCFFIIFENKKTYKWISIFLPYPIMILSDLIIDVLTKQHVLPPFLFLPYLIIIFFIIFYKKKLAKSFKLNRITS